MSEYWVWNKGKARALFSSKKQGNVSLAVGDSPHKVISARQEVASLIELDIDDIISVSQVHKSSAYRVLSEIDKSLKWGSGLFPSVEADALVTDNSGVGLAILVADCAPIVLVCGDSVAAIHAGWRSVIGGVIEAAVNEIKRSASFKASDTISAMIGPCIGKCCFEVDDEVAKLFSSEHVVYGAQIKPKVDLSREIALRLSVAGVQVESIDVCTKCSEELFSFRRNKDAAGRQCVVITRG